MNKLPLDFYKQADVLEISRQLIGKYLFTNFHQVLTGGMIVETEAYRAFGDQACHAHRMRHTKCKMMYEAGGVSYVYRCYGIHSLLNIVTNQKDIPDAVLIRALEPTIGIETMLKRRHKEQVGRLLTGGPGALSEALGINPLHNGLLLTSSQIWIEDRSHVVLEENILTSSRVGIAYAKEDALLPWRFRLKNSKWTSPAK